MAYMFMACMVMAYIVMAYMSMASIVVAYIVMVYIVMAHIVTWLARTSASIWAGDPEQQLCARRLGPGFGPGCDLGELLGVDAHLPCLSII